MDQTPLSICVVDGVEQSSIPSYVEPYPNTFARVGKSKTYKPDKDKWEYDLNYHQDGWNRGIWGYCDRARLESNALQVNERLGEPYTCWAVWAIDRVIALWKVKELQNREIPRALADAGISGLSVIENSLDTGKVHFNIIIKGQFSVTHLERTIKGILPDVPSRLWIRRIYYSAGLCNYILKAKVADPTRNLKDKYQSKRVLLADNTGIRKMVWTSDFYVIRKTMIINHLLSCDVETTVQELSIIQPKPKPKAKSGRKQYLASYYVRNRDRLKQKRKAYGKEQPSENFHL